MERRLAVPDQQASGRGRHTTLTVVRCERTTLVGFVDDPEPTAMGLAPAQSRRVDGEVIDGEVIDGEVMFTVGSFARPSSARPVVAAGAQSARARGCLTELQTVDAGASFTYSVADVDVEVSGTARRAWATTSRDPASSSMRRPEAPIAR